jgi:hypothetical protein
MESCPVTIKVDSYRILWTNRPITIKVGFLLESASYNNKVSESNDEVEFL